MSLSQFSLGLLLLKLGQNRFHLGPVRDMTYHGQSEIWSLRPYSTTLRPRRASLPRRFSIDLVGGLPPSFLAHGLLLSGLGQ
uniref:Uncharacterized protein n=1 Tax=Cannabis sativa TaxID=3483 RepID=A0A803Q784_CANSA